MDDEFSSIRIRGIFPRNLRALVNTKGTVSRIARDLKIHRSQMNRFLDGSAFPKPDMLHRICRYFNVDANVLIEPLSTSDLRDNSRPRAAEVNPEIAKFMVLGDNQNDTSIMPCGFYKFTRGSFLVPNAFQTGLVWVYRKDGVKFIKGYMARNIASLLGKRLNSRRDREFRGMILGNERGVLSMAAHLNSKSYSLTYLDIQSFVEKEFLSGYCARTMPQINGEPAVRKTVYERLPNDRGLIRSVCRQVGMIKVGDIPSYLHPYLLG